MILLTKLDSLQRCFARIALKAPPNVEVLQGDLGLQDIITLNLERAVQGCVDIAAHIVAESNVPAPTTMAESFERLRELDVITAEMALRMKNSVGFRNVAVQEYQKIDWLIVYRIITEHLDDFKGYAMQALDWSNESSR